MFDGVYELIEDQPRFRRVAPPTSADIEALLGRVVQRIARHLERCGLLVRDAENSYLNAVPDGDSALEGLPGHSITYRIAVGPNEGRKALTLQTLAPAERHRAMRWAQRLKRVFRIDIETCERCGGKVKIIASIEDPAVIGRILAYLEMRARSPFDITAAHRPRGPPGQLMLDLI